MAIQLAVIGGVNTVGLCHGVQGGHGQIAKVIEFLVNNVRKPGCRGLVPVGRKDVGVLRRIEYYSTESNGHLSEYPPWYRKNLARTAKWIDPSTWIGGETGGYLRVCTEGRDDFNRNFGKWMKAPPKPITPESRSHEHGSYIVEALETGRVYRGTRALKGAFRRTR